MAAHGIDFGTTNSVVASFDGGDIEVLPIDEPPVAWQGRGFELVLPSVVALTEDRAPVFGWDAKRRRNAVHAVKRLLRDSEVMHLGDDAFEVEEIATMIFRHLASASPGTSINKAVVTVPANSRGVARHRTKVCAGMAGVQVPALINEPTAAAMAASFQSSHDGTLMVVDWGGGTLDVTVLRTVEGVFIEEAADGIGKLGGLDFDAALRRHLEESNPQAMRAATPAARSEYFLDVERAKVDLSTRETATVQMPDGSVQQIGRDEFDRIVRPLIDRVRDPVSRCIEDLRGQPIDRLVLVGGTCNIPAVRDLVADLVGINPMPGVNPMTAIAEGAAIASAILDDQLDSHDFFVSTEHALGTVAIGPSSEAPEFSVIIPRNHKLPAKRSETYIPMSDFQQSVLINIIEGDPTKPLDDPDNVIYEEYEVALPGREIAHAAIGLTLEYDVNGLLHVKVTDETTDDVLQESTVSFGAAADPSSRVRIAKRVSQTFDEGRVETREPQSTLDPDATRAVGDAQTKVLPFIDDDERAELVEAIDAVIAGGPAQPLRQMLDRRWPYLL